MVRRAFGAQESSWQSAGGSATPNLPLSSLLIF
jgi:hypothetical protein